MSIKLTSEFTLTFYPVNRRVNPNPNKGTNPMTKPLTVLNRPIREFRIKNSLITHYSLTDLFNISVGRREPLPTPSEWLTCREARLLTENLISGHVTSPVENYAPLEHLYIYATSNEVMRKGLVDGLLSKKVEKLELLHGHLIALTVMRDPPVEHLSTLRMIQLFSLTALKKNCIVTPSGLVRMRYHTEVDDDKYDPTRTRSPFRQT